jgi:hypothetical protein
MADKIDACLGIITARFGAAEGDPLTIKYSAAPVDTGKNNGVITNHLPVRRISKGAMVVAAEVGDPCVIVWVGQKTFLHVFTEGIPFQEACT